MPLSGPYTEPDWIDRPVWTPQALAEAARKAQERKDREAFERHPDYHWTAPVWTLDSI